MGEQAIDARTYFSFEKAVGIRINFTPCHPCPFYALPLCILRPASIVTFAFLHPRLPQMLFLHTEAQDRLTTRGSDPEGHQQFTEDEDVFQPIEFWQPCNPWMFFACRLRHPECVSPRAFPIMTEEPKGFEAHYTLRLLFNCLKDLEGI